MTDDILHRLSAALSGRYRIEKKLGEGGMASVYLAEDPKHQRRVAVKVLRPELAAVIGAERFLSEITTTARLQHPHILALFDSGEADGFLYYVMPFIEGETLRDRLDREKQLGVDEAVGIARDVADALDYAHRNGVIHRDIKPANILLHDGRPVVADFGIALAISAAGGGRMTETGLSLGTPHYMSPEQASADRDLSARSDVYSLGCVLYEMIAGQPPHTGPSAQSILVRILTETPRPLTELRHTVPPHVAAVVAKSIEKLPADRFESARGFKDALGDGSFSYSPSAPTPRATAPAVTAAGRSPRRGVPVWAAGILGIVLLAAGYALSRLTTPEPAVQPSAIFKIVGDSLHELTSPCCGRSVAVSPTGDRVVYQGTPAGPGNGVLLYQRLLGRLDALPIPGTEGARHPFFSPDGQWVGFFSGDALRKIRFDGGAPLTVTAGLEDNAGAAWAPDNSIVFSTRVSRVLFRVVDGSPPQQLTQLDTVAGERDHAWPHVMPDGRTVLFSVRIQRDGNDQFMLAATTLDGGEHRLLTGGADPRFVEPGFLVFSDAAGSIMAQRFDAGSLEVSGERFRLAANSTWRGDGSSEFDISLTGTLAYLEGSSFAGGTRVLVSVDLQGNEQLITSAPGSFAPRYSPDGRFVAYSVNREDGAAPDIWVWDLLRGIPNRVTVSGDARFPEWSPDGTEILYSAPAGILAQRADGSGAPRVIQERPSSTDPWVPRITPDGAWLLGYNRDGADRGWDVWIRPLAGGELRPLLDSPFWESDAVVSPDGRWVAYNSDASGSPEVYVEPFPGLGRRFKVTSGGAYAPLWAPDGRRLYFLRDSGDGRALQAVDVRASNDFDVGPPVTLFNVQPYLSSATVPLFDIHPDGTRFVFFRSSFNQEARSQVVVTNAVAAALEGGR